MATRRVTSPSLVASDLWLLVPILLLVVAVGWRVGGVVGGVISAVMGAGGTASSSSTSKRSSISCTNPYRMALFLSSRKTLKVKRGAKTSKIKISVVGD
jgi:hypothetical protein